MRHIITPEERGHRKPLSDKEGSKVYGIAVVKSTHDRLAKAGTEKVREHLNNFRDKK